MLILISGITGPIGQHLTRQALVLNHTVRGIARDKSKLSSDLVGDPRVNFIKVDHYHDEAALDSACEGCDAVICAYPIIPSMQLEAQMFLLRAAERANIKLFVASSWSGDYRRLNLGDMESYDPYICFRHYLKLVSKINPIFVFIGVFAETFYNDYHPGTTEASVWVRERDTVNTWGTGNELLTVTTMRDAAAYTIRILEREQADRGGRLARVLLQNLVILGSLEGLRREEAERRSAGSKLDYWQYLTWTYWVNLLSGRLEGATDNRSFEFSDDCRTSLKDWFIQNHL